MGELFHCQIPLVSFSSLSMEFRDKAIHPYYSRTVPSVYSGAIGAVEFVVALGWKQVRVCVCVLQAVAGRCSVHYG